MTVKQLITKLMDFPLDSPVVVANDVEHLDDWGDKVKGYMFAIKDVDMFGSVTEIVFDDYREENK